MLAFLPALAALSFSPLQDPLTTEHLEPHVHRFRVVDGALEGSGAAFVRAELERHGAVLLGEYHGSHAIGEFTRALVPILDELGCRHFALELGPTSAKMLNDLAGDGSETIARLREFNSRFQTRGKRGWRSVIPFFTGVEDAQFLAEAAKRDWHLFGVDQEFVYGFAPLVDQLGAGLQAEGGTRAKGLSDSARAAVDSIYGSTANAVPGLLASDELRALLDASEESGGERADLARDLRTSLDIYRLNLEGDWWRSNGARVAHMKANLGRGLRSTDFDAARDRLLVKIGGVHSGRGISPIRHYELGQTVSELMELHGRRSLHVNFTTRFWSEGEGVVDLLEEDERYEVVRCLGVQQQWTLVDLRPLRRAVFYDRIVPERFTKEWFAQHDWIVIAPTDRPVEPNRDSD